MIDMISVNTEFIIKNDCHFAAIRVAGEIGFGAIASKRFEEIRFDHKCTDARIEEIQPRRRFEDGTNI